MPIWVAAAAFSFHMLK